MAYCVDILLGLLGVNEVRVCVGTRLLPLFPLRLRWRGVKVPEQRTQVDPESAIFQTVGDGFDVEDHVWSSVDEEASCYCIKDVLILRLLVYLTEVACSY